MVHGKKRGKEAKKTTAIGNESSGTVTLASEGKYRPFFPREDPSNPGRIQKEKGVVKNVSSN